jgi:hypothetical protein
MFVFSCNNDRGTNLNIPKQQKTNSEANPDNKYEKELDEIRKTIQGEVKVRLKKDGKGYSWEITGKDAQEVIKTNETLRKRLGD